MEIKDYKKSELLELANQDYRVLPCKDPEDVQKNYDILISNGREALPGHIINKEKKDVYFIVTKKKVARRGRPRKEVK